MSQLSGVRRAVILCGLLSLSSLGVQASERFNWSSNVWVQPTWSSSWGSGYRDPWRWGIGVGTGWNHYPYLNRPYWNGRYQPYGRSWNYPYRYDRRQYKQPEPKVMTPPQRVTTSVQYASGLKSLPENARVIQKDGRTVYEWQGVEYVFDWSSETYRELK